MGKLYKGNEKEREREREKEREREGMREKEREILCLSETDMPDRQRMVRDIDDNGDRHGQTESH